MPMPWSMPAATTRAGRCRSISIPAPTIRNYIGDTREANPNSGPWFQAIANTSNQVMLYNGEHVVAHYSSSNGGYMSEDTFRSLANRKPYLRAAPDPYDSYTNPFATWQVTFSHADLSRWLNAYNDTSIGTIVSVSISGTRETSGRVNPATVTLTGTSGTKSVSGSRFYAVVERRQPAPEQQLSPGRCGLPCSMWAMCLRLCPTAQLRPRRLRPRRPRPPLPRRSSARPTR